jgi:PAS domain S-box-containing protein
MHTERSFAADGRSVAEARHFVREMLDQWGAEDLTDEAVLATSELVTNAIVHAGTTVRVTLLLDAQGLRLEVQDLHPHRSLPLGPEQPDADTEHGRGLFITASLASSWGVDYSAGAKRVWLRIERSGGPPAPPPQPAGGRVTDLPDGAVAVVGLSADGLVQSWNPDAQRLTGWTPDDVVGRPWLDLLDEGDAAPSAEPQPWADPRWQGLRVVRRKDGTTAEMFASSVLEQPGSGSMVLLVPAARRAVLEWPAPTPRTTAKDQDPLGLRENALNRLGSQAYLDLVVERCRDRLSAQGAYLLLTRDMHSGFDVATFSGLDDAVRGIHLEPGEVGAPDARNPQMPVLLPDLGPSGVPLIGAEDARSLLVVPVVMDGLVIGALGVVSEARDDFSDDQAILLQRVANTVAPAVDRARLRVSQRERRGWLSLLAEAGDLLAGSLDQEMTMAITGQIVVPLLATWCTLSLVDERDHPVLQQVWHRDEDEGPRLRAALEELAPDADVDSRAKLLDATVLDIPLVARGRRLGVLTLGRPVGEPLQGEALLAAESIARRAALAIDNARTHGELQDVGEALQRSLLPASIPTSPTFDLGVVYEAAGERSLVGGDFYDVFPVSGGTWCFAVGDVCGTGAEAAAVTGLARHTIRALVLAGFPVPSVLERLNAAIVEEGERSRFITVICGVLQPEPGGRLRVSLVCAGHPLPFVVRRSGRIEQIGRPQSLLGVMEKVAFVAEDHLLERGDLLVAVTDGVLERRDGTRMLDEDGLAADLAGTGDLPAQAVAERIRRLVSDFAPTPQADDMAVLALRVTPGD